MNKDFNYYLIIEANKGRTPILAHDFEIDEYGLRYLYKSIQQPEDHIHPMYFDPKIRNPNMNTDCLTMETFSVFSKKVRDALVKHGSIKGLQLVQASIEEGEYMDFYVANIYQRFDSFDKKLSKYDEITPDYWEDISKIVLDKEILAKIPLEDRLVYIAKEDSQFKLYHESVIDIIKSVDPVGMTFLPVEEWHEGSLFDFMR